MNMYYLSRPEDAIFAPLVRSLAKILTDQKRMLVTAESCTGGLAAALCTDMAGSSAWFTGGIVAYSNVLKKCLLAVPAHTLDTAGAVSGKTVKAMAVGALQYADNAEDADRGRLRGASLAISGIAGPDGGSEDKPVGTVWIAWAAAAGNTAEPCGINDGMCDVQAEKFFFPGDRDQIRLAAAREALRGMAEFLQRMEA